MKHLLHDPAFPDLVGEWAAHETANAVSRRCANDNAGAKKKPAAAKKPPARHAPKKEPAKKAAGGRKR